MCPGGYVSKRPALGKTPQPFGGDVRVLDGVGLGFFFAFVISCLYYSHKWAGKVRMGSNPEWPPMGGWGL